MPPTSRFVPSKQEFLARVVKELALDTSDPFTLLFGNACALLDQRDALKAAIAGCQQSFAWLVETQVNDSLVLYWHGEPGATTWAQDATKAARFPSRSAADWAITVNKFYDRDVCGYPRPKAVEHGFIYAAASENRTQEALRACLTAMTNELNDTGRWVGGGPGSKYRDAMRDAEEALK